MIYLELAHVLSLHTDVIRQSGGAMGVRDLGALQSALAQPRMTFGGNDVYPSLIDKAAALAFSLVMNHPFVDGNKRVGQMAMEAMLLLNGFEVDAPVDEQESVFLRLAAGQLTREQFVDWLTRHVVPHEAARKDS
jgi:death-on-curing protein